MAKKSKEFRLAQIAFHRGWVAGCSSSEAMTSDLVEQGAAEALAVWKDETGGKKRPVPTDIERARKEWDKAGRPAEGVMFDERLYVFEPDGSFNLKKNFEHHFLSAEAGK